MIDKNKTYRTRNGKEAIIYTTDRLSRDGNMCVVGAYVSESDRTHIVLVWNYDGTRTLNDEDPLDLVEYNPLGDFKIDDPVYVRDSIVDPWVVRHFSGVVDGKVSTWIGGCTSYTAEHPDDRYVWHHFQKFEKKD